MVSEVLQIQVAASLILDGKLNLISCQHAPADGNKNPKVSPPVAPSREVAEELVKQNLGGDVTSDYIGCHSSLVPAAA